MPGASPRVAEPQRHVVVFDCNVYLDVARLLGPPFSWERFEDEVARRREDQSHAAYSLKAIAVCTSGRFCGDEPLEVWTSQHVTETVLYKARESSIPDPATGYCGLGWPAVHVETLSHLVYELAEQTGGGDVGYTFPDGNPPLDQEDGLVMGACRVIAREDPLCNVYCVTRDRGFIAASRDARFPTHTRVLSPRTFVEMVRAARNSSRPLPPPPKC